MGPPKRKASSNSQPASDATIKPKVKRVTRTQIEESICSKRLNALDQEESKNLEDRFSAPERRILLDAYNERGFGVFQDTQLLSQYFPNRSESNLKGLIQRLKTQGPNSGPDDSAKGELCKIDYVDDWRTLCHQLLGNYVKDRKINIEDSIPEALSAVADSLEAKLSESGEVVVNEEGPNYPQLIRSFAQLLTGRFPDDMTPANARLSSSLFEHVCGMVESVDINSLQSKFDNGKWLESNHIIRQERFKLALEGLEKIDGKTKKCPTIRDLEKDKSMEALCLELPKIKRISDMLNPLSITIDDLLASSLIGNVSDVG